MATDNLDPIDAGAIPPKRPAPDVNDSCWSAARIEILAWLKQNAPSLAELYEGAVGLFCTQNLPGWTRMFCHSIREIGNELPGVVTGEEGGMILQHTARVDAIVTEWMTHSLPLDGSLPGAQMIGAAEAPMTIPPAVELPSEVYVSIAALVRDHSESRQTRSDAAMRMFAVLIPEQNMLEAFRPMIQQWRKAIQWFVGKAHDKKWKDSDLNLIEMKAQFEIFEATLAAALRQFVATSKDINDIIKRANL